MIKSECFEKEWIDKVCSSHKFKHPELVEKVIRAFSLLEMLVKEGCPLTFKGGTSLLLILGSKAPKASSPYDGLYTRSPYVSESGKRYHTDTKESDLGDRHHLYPHLEL